MVRISSILILTWLLASCMAQDSDVYSAGTEGSKNILNDSTVRVFSGNRICVSSAMPKGKVCRLKLINAAQSQIAMMKDVADILAKQCRERNICIDLNTISDEQGKTITVLIINNPYPGLLSYKVKMFSAHNNHYETLSFAPVKSGVSGIQVWPYPIPDLVLSDFAVVQ